GVATNVAIWLTCLPIARRRIRTCGRRAFSGPRSGAGAGAERVAGAGTIATSARARYFTSALSRLGLDLAYGLFERQPLPGDLGLAKRRFDTAQLRDQRGARPFIERAATLAGSTGVQSGDGAGNQRVVV